MTASEWYALELLRRIDNIIQQLENMQHVLGSLEDEEE